MRTAKYHDYTLLRILLFIILVVLGLFAYKHFVKAPCEHTSSNGWVTVEPTCTEDGYRYKVCSDCGEQFGNQVLAALGHKLDNTVIEIEPATCTSKGSGYKACSVCKEELEFVELPVIEHTYGDTVIENVKEHTLTQGASYENVVYCTECNAELSRDEVKVEHTVTVTTTTTADPTCTEKGEEVTVIYCNECDKAISTETKVLEPKGHSFAWQLSYVEGDFVLDGKCTASECEYEYDPAVDTAYTYVVEKDEAASVEACCISGYDIYVAIIYLEGAEVGRASVKVDLAPNQNHTILCENGPLMVEDYIKYDENGVAYFNISTPGIVLVYEKQEGQTTADAMAAAWDANGFALGTFKCGSVVGEGEHWVTVRVFNDLADNSSAESDPA